MPQLIEAEVADLGALPPEDAEAFLRGLFPVVASIFARDTAERFVSQFMRTDAIRKRVQVYRNEQGDIVGYCGIRIFEVPVENRVTGVLRAEAGLLPSYRGTGRTLWFGAKEAIRYKALHPARTVVLFLTLVHPSSYHMFSKYVWRCYPYPGRRFPERWKKLLIALIDWAGYEPADPADPLIRKVEHFVRESDADVQTWQQSPHEDVRYYVRRNPGFARGLGLTWIAPISILNLLVTTISYSLHLTLNWLAELRIFKGTQTN